MRPVLVSMSGPAVSKKNFNLSKVSDFEAGIILLDDLAQVFPGLTVGQLLALGDGHLERMGKHWWEKGPVGVITRNVGKAADTLNPEKVIESAGHIVGEAVRGVGHVGAEFLRTMTSDQVLHFANSSYDHFTADGGVSGAIGGGQFSGGYGGGGSESGGQAGSGSGDWWEYISGFISNLGGQAKAQASGAGLPGGVLPWALGGGVVLILLMRGGRH